MVSGRRQRLCHKKKFVVGVCLEEEMVARGEGLSKQEAQMNAATQALEEKDWQG